MTVPTWLAIGALLGIVSGGAGLATPVGESPWVDQTNSKVRLVSGTVERAGNPAPFAGVQLRMAPGWKTYWRNPGDSGVPPTFDWSGSKNLKSADVLYPAPHRFVDAGGTAIGYSDEVVFPVRITPEREGDPVELALNFDYGLCKDLCIPNEAELRAALPPGLGKGDAALLDTALAQVPLPAAFDALPRIERVTATLDGPAPGLEVEALFPHGASETDLFVSSPDVPVPVPKALGPLDGGRQRFTVAFMSPEEAAAIKGKPLLFTLVSDQGTTETTWTVD
ncbi:MAG: protein-disulfide reductase DsbD domain-containing protein [Methyloceanibacter sp.]